MLVALLLGCVLSLALAFLSAGVRAERSATRAHSAADRLAELTAGFPADDSRRAAIAWGYAERMRLGLESPFLLIESASRDPRITAEERRTVSQALLSHVLNGQTHLVDPATLDGLGPYDGGRAAAGERHLALITHAVESADDPRAGELAVRLGYALATAERVLVSSAPRVAAWVAALVADREIARREAHALLRASDDPVEELALRRARRAFYVEKPALMAPNQRLELEAIARSRLVLESLRRLASSATADSARPSAASQPQPMLARQLLAAGAQMPPSASLAVTVRRHLPSIRALPAGPDRGDLSRAHNAEMLVAASGAPASDRNARRAMGRLLVAAAVAERSRAQQRVWFPGEQQLTAAQVAAETGVASVTFDAPVPAAWRPFYLQQLSDGVRDLRRVFPGFGLGDVHVRFRMSPPSDSALAMHEPRTRTLHLPVVTAAGTLTHELAHDLDRRTAVREGHAGYRSDFVARNGVREKERGTGASVAASLRALTDDAGDATRAAAGVRPAEIFATQVDWFVAKALASRGLSNGFLSAVQDELLTGHVVHAERVRSRGRPTPLVDALTGMTAVAPFALAEEVPTAYSLLRWALEGTVDREIATDMLAGGASRWMTPSLGGEAARCQDDAEPRALLVRMAAESKARGWVRQRSRWDAERVQAAWAGPAAASGPWAPELLERRIARLSDRILLQLSAGELLPTGIGAVAAPLAAQARCVD